MASPHQHVTRLAQELSLRVALLGSCSGAGRGGGGGSLMPPNLVPCGRRRRGCELTLVGASAEAVASASDLLGSVR